MVKTEDNLNCADNCRTLYDTEKSDSYIKTENKAQVGVNVVKINVKSEKNKEKEKNFSEERTLERNTEK